MYSKSLQFLKSTGCLLGLFWLTFSGSLWAQTPQHAYVSNSTATNSIPLGGSVWADQRNQWIYGVGDFGTVPGGMAITTLYLRQGTISDPACTWTNFSIKLGQPNMTSGFNGTWITGLTTVLSSTSYSMPATSANQWLQFDLDVPFLYDPTKPLVVETYQTATPTGRKTLQAGGTTSNMSGNTQQYGSTSAGTGTPRRYSYSCGFDLISMNIDVTEINFVTDLCQLEQQTVSVKIKNTDLNAQTGFWVEYSIDGVYQSTDVYTDTIQPGDSAWHTFVMPVNTSTAGTFTLTSNISGKTPIASHNYTVKPSPLGSFVVKGTPFVGSFNSGDAADPDIVAYGDNIHYEISPPTGYNNSDYSSTWEFTTWTMMTKNGTPAAGTFSSSNPNGSNNADGSFTPVIGQSDSSFLMCYSIKSLSNGCSAPELCRELFVAPRPIAGFNATTACEGMAVQFTNTTTVSSGLISYVWDFGDGSSSILINPSHIYSTHGTFNVTLTATTQYGYVNVTGSTVTVNQNPTAEFGFTNVCEGSVTPFSDGSVIPAGTPTYEWDFGDGSAPGSGPNPTHQYATPDVYTVTMKVTSNGCSDMTSEYVTYAPRAVVDFSPSATTCNSDMVTFTNGTTISSGQVGYSWDFGDNTTSTQINPVHSYGIFGTIDITLTAKTDLGCVDVITKQINLIEAPKADFTTSLLCDKNDVDFTNMTVEPASANTTYEWAFSDGTSYMTKDVSRSFPSLGGYTVTLKAFADNGCLSTLTRSFSLEEAPSAEFYADNVCEGEDVEFLNASVGNGGNFSSTWDFGVGGTNTDNNPVVTLPVGAHNVMLTVTTPNGCATSVSKTVTVYPKPVATTLSVESGEKGDGTFVLIASVTPLDANYAIFWGDGGRSFGSATNGQITEIYPYGTDGNYEVELRLDKNGCNTTSKGSASVTRTGLLNVSGGSLNVYPNPGNGIFNLDLSALNTLDMQIEIYAADGQLIHANVEVSGESARLDLGSAVAGVYFVRVHTATGIHSARITLNK
ncbi:MAG TPA: hypothetical protein DIW47_04835 [Bacteroidetes bacterium]|nr:hypothetical protein [Bacteroidota bacterium]